MINDEAFLLIMGEGDGCINCDGHVGLKADIFYSLKDLVNSLHDRLEKNNEYYYPVELYLIDCYDAEILGNLMLSYKSGCIGGLYEYSFIYNKIRYKIIKGKRQKKEIL